MLKQKFYGKVDYYLTQITSFSLKRIKKYKVAQQAALLKTFLHINNFYKLNFVVYILVPCAIFVLYFLIAAVIYRGTIIKEFFNIKIAFEFFIYFFLLLR